MNSNRNIIEKSFILDVSPLNISYEIITFANINIIPYKGVNHSLQLIGRDKRGFVDHNINATINYAYNYNVINNSRIELSASFQRTERQYLTYDLKIRQMSSQEYEKRMFVEWYCDQIYTFDSLCNYKYATIKLQ